MEITFIQCSTHLINAKTGNDELSLFYDRFYQENEKLGYYRPEHFWELPLWITEASHILNKTEKELYIVQDVKQAIEDLKDKEYILMSVLEVNKNIYLEIIKSLHKPRFIIGGYVDFTEFKELYNVHIMHDMKSFHDAWYCDPNKKYNQGVSYELFKGIKTIPRLTLSTGCKHSCKFCTIENELIEKSCKDIWQQLESFIDLDFKLVYLNDKTFGQASNYWMLREVYKRIKQYNSKFEGFIIQTTASKASNMKFICELKGMHVKIVELGIESFNDDILKELKKPANEFSINKAVSILQKLNIKVIGNIITGFPMETKESYKKTFEFIKSKNLFHLNVYNLALYQDTKLASELQAGNEDFNELEVKKSYMTDQDYFNVKWFITQLLTKGIK